MNRKETGIIMDILTTAYPRFYAGPAAPDVRQTLNLWAEMFAHDDVCVVAAAVKSVIESDEKGFPPTIGQVKAKIRLLTSRDSTTEAEAWGLISKAVRNSLYDSAREFEKLPAVLQRLVGSPSQLREWAMMDSDTLHSVVASNVQRSYKVVAARQAEIEKLPADVRGMVAQIGGGAALGIEGTQPEALPEGRVETQEEALAKLEAERRAYWAKLEAREEAKKRSREEIIAQLRGEGKQ